MKLSNEINDSLKCLDETLDQHLSDESDLKTAIIIDWE